MTTHRNGTNLVPADMYQGKYFCVFIVTHTVQTIWCTVIQEEQHRSTCAITQLGFLSIKRNILKLKLALCIYLFLNSYFRFCLILHYETDLILSLGYFILCLCSSVGHKILFVTKLKGQAMISFCNQLLIEKWVLPEKSAYHFISEKLLEQDAGMSN